MQVAALLDERDRGIRLIDELQMERVVARFDSSVEIFEIERDLEA
jgi:hypothetical protein